MKIATNKRRVGALVFLCRVGHRRAAWVAREEAKEIPCEWL